ncbi:MAG: phage antirepressor N-terminal domain-containing protein [Fluviibacter sp.]
MNQIIPVSFHGDSLAIVDNDGQPFVPMRPIVKNMGLDWRGQHEKLTAKFGSVVGIIPTTGEDGKQYQMICLPLRKIYAWLYSINPNKVNPEIRDKVIQYQEECDDVLWQYWTTGHVENPAIAKHSDAKWIAANNGLPKLLDRLEAETHPQKRVILQEQIKTACKTLGFEAPDLNCIGFAEDFDSQLADIWEAIEQIGVLNLNHSRTRGILALSLPHLYRAAADVGIALPHLETTRRLLRRSNEPLFSAIKTVNSRLFNRSMKCWTFLRSDK